MADDLLTLTVQNKKKKNTQVIVKEKVLTPECREKIADKETQKELKEKRSTEWKEKRESKEKIKQLFSAKKQMKMLVHQELRFQTETKGSKKDMD